MSAEARRTIAKTPSEPRRSIATAGPRSAPFAVTDPPEYASSVGSGCDSRVSQCVKLSLLHSDDITTFLSVLA